MVTSVRRGTGDGTTQRGDHAVGPALTRDESGSRWAVARGFGTFLRSQRRLSLRRVPFALIAIVVASGCASPHEPEPPRTWESSTVGSSIDIGHATIEIDKDGTGTVADLPEVAGADGDCAPSSSDRYSGPIEWTAQGRGAIRLAAESRVWILRAGFGKFGTGDWSEAAVDFCPTSGSTPADIVRFVSFDD